MTVHKTIYKVQEEEWRPALYFEDGADAREVAAALGWGDGSVEPIRVLAANAAKAEVVRGLPATAPMLAEASNG